MHRQIARSALSACVALAVFTAGANASVVATFTVAQTYDLPTTHGSAFGGLSFDGTYLWANSLDPNGMTYGLRIDPTTGLVVSTPVLAGAGPALAPPTGAAWGGGHLFTTSQTGTIQEASSYSDASPTALPSGGLAENLFGLAWDGSYLWQTSNAPGGDNLYRYTADGFEVGHYLIDPYPTGLASDGRYLWVAHDTTFMDTPATEIERYDRSGQFVEAYQLPTGLGRLGDLEFDGTYLWALSRTDSKLYKLSIPASQNPTVSLPSGVLGVSYQTSAQMQYRGVTYNDALSASGYGQVPVASSLMHPSPDPNDGDAVAASARAYSDSDAKMHHVLHALAIGDNSESPVIGFSALTLAKSIQIAPTSSLPEGLLVNATGSMTISAVLQAFRDTTTTATQGMEASFQVTINLIRSGLADQTVFDGTIALEKSDSDWVDIKLGGGLDTTDIQALADSSMDCGDFFATLALTGVQVPYSVQVRVGEAFTLQVYMQARAEAQGLGKGVEVALGNPAVFTVKKYGSGRVPEPATVLLLAAGFAVLKRARRCRLQ